jgi:hypothetical protein
MRHTRDRRLGSAPTAVTSRSALVSATPFRRYESFQGPLEFESTGHMVRSGATKKKNEAQGLTSLR